MKVVLVGAGRYANAVHIPYLQNSKHAELTAIIDPAPYTDTRHPKHQPMYEDTLLQFLEKRADGVIISTQPTERNRYYNTIFDQPYHLHIDKPFLAVENAIDTKIDYKTFRQQYLNQFNNARKHRMPVSLHTQRRYDPKIQKIREHIRHSYNTTGIIPHRITYHGHDGNFRTNHEWNTETYHGLHDKQGILQHSLYHYVDTIAYLLNPLPITIHNVQATANATTCNEHQHANKHAEKRILGSVSDATPDGIIDTTINYTITTSHGQIQCTVTVSHLGTTRRDGPVDNHLQDNRYSQKTLTVTAGNILTARYTSEPKDLATPNTKQDTLRIDNTVKQATLTESTTRNKKLDTKRRECLQDFVQTYTEGAQNESHINTHTLSTKLFLQAYKAHTKQ